MKRALLLLPIEAALALFLVFGVTLAGGVLTGTNPDGELDDSALTSMLIDSVEAANPSRCGIPVEVVRNPIHTAVSNVIGPAYVTAKWRNQSPRARDLWWNPHTQPWTMTIKTKVNKGEQAKFYGAEVNAVMYKRTADCQAKVNGRFRAMSLPARSLNTLEQWGLAETYRVGS